MSVEAAKKPSKGEATRRRIVRAGLERAARLGLEGLTIGDLSSSMGLSKSGLFAHFKSKEKLQLAVLDAAADDFSRRVFLPAMSIPRGEPRLRAILDNWMAWSRAPHESGGCIFIAGAMEWDDRSGPVREAIVERFNQLLSNLRRAIWLCVEEGHLPPDADLDLLTSELHGVVLKHHLDCRLLESPKAEGCARRAVDHVLSHPPRTEPTP